MLLLYNISSLTASKISSECTIIFEEEISLKFMGALDRDGIHETYIGIVTKHVIIALFTVYEFEFVELHILGCFFNCILLSDNLLLELIY